MGSQKNVLPLGTNKIYTSPSFKYKRNISKLTIECIEGKKKSKKILLKIILVKSSILKRTSTK